MGVTFVGWWISERHFISLQQTSREKGTVDWCWCSGMLSVLRFAIGQSVQDAIWGIGRLSVWHAQRVSTSLDLCGLHSSGRASTLGLVWRFWPWTSLALQCHNHSSAEGVQQQVRVWKTHRPSTIGVCWFAIARTRTLKYRRSNQAPWNQ